MMIPITRKEKYINEIVGGGNTAPETPQTREELFYAAILGEVVAPSPITRAEKYLAKIANKYNGELPEPVTRIERFLARAAGMNVSIPTPVTREEMLWADYALIVEKELSGIPPLTFNAIAGTLKNYRIYGNTVNGESVGELVTDSQSSNYGKYKISVTLTADSAETTDIYLDESLCKIGTYTDYADYENQNVIRKVVRKVFNGTEQFNYNANNNTIDYIVPTIIAGNATTINCSSNHITSLSGDMNWQSRNIPDARYISASYSGGSSKIRFVWNDNNGVMNLYDLKAQLSTWYANGNPLIVNYIIETPVEEQVTLPAISTLAGTNTLTVGTEVQPSNVYIKYEGAR